MSDVKIAQPGGDDDGFSASESSKEVSPRPAGGRAYKNHLERGWVAHRLIREIALGEKTGRQLAEEYGVSQTSMSQFKRRHSFEIESVRNNLADEYAHLWVAQKINRIAELQRAAEKMADGTSPRNAEVLVNILRAASEELGQLPSRTQVNVSTEQVTYQIVGIDPEDI